MAIKTFTTGEVLTAADTNTYLANSGLVYITTTTATSGTTLNISNCFSSTFNNYRVIISGYQPSSASAIIMQLGTGSAVNTNYYWAGAYLSAYTAAPTLAGYGGNAAAQVELQIVGDATHEGGGNVEIYSPNLATRTAIMVQGIDARTAANPRLAITGFQDSATQFTSLHITSTQTISNLVVTVYGYRKA
jgi:hypothetical protein